MQSNQEQLSQVAGNFDSIVNHEPEYYHYILRSKVLLNSVTPEYFDDHTLGDIYACAKRLYTNERYNVDDITPNDVLAEYLTQHPDVSEDYATKLIYSLYSEKNRRPGQGESVLRDKCSSWVKWKSVCLGTVDLINLIKKNGNLVHEDNIDQLIQQVKTITERSTTMRVEESTFLDFMDPMSHMGVDLRRTSTGDNNIDRWSAGGYWSGSLWVIMGAPKSGKSLVLQNMAADAFRHNLNVMYITLELQGSLSIQRFGHNLLGISSSEYSQYTNEYITDTNGGENIPEDHIAKGVDEVSLAIKDFKKTNDSGADGKRLGTLLAKEFPTSTASVLDIESYLLGVQKDMSVKKGKPYKFDVVYVDYLNITKNWRNPNTENTYLKIKSIAEDLRAMGARNDWCIVTATQTNREQFDASDISVRNTSESSAVNATADIMIGIIRDEVDQLQGTLRLKCLLSRVSSFGNDIRSYKVYSDYMRISPLTGTSDEEYKSLREKTLGDLESQQSDRNRDSGLLGRVVSGYNWNKSQDPNTPAGSQRVDEDGTVIPGEEIPNDGLTQTVTEGGMEVPATDGSIVPPEGTHEGKDSGVFIP